MKKALIIGGAGFVGKHLADHLHNHCGWSVCITKMENEQLELDYVEALDLDILEMESVVETLNQLKPNYIFHLAAQSSVSLSWENPQLTVDVNIKGSINVLEAVKKLNYKPRLLLIGSGEEYGKIKENECPIKEDNVIRPSNIYAVTKACQNMLGKIYADAYDLDIISVRAFNHVGPGQLPTFVVSDFCKQVAEIEAGKRKPVIYVGNLSAKRDFTDVRDVVRAYALLAEKGEKGQTYNVGSGKAVVINAVLEEILSCSCVDIRIVVDENRFRPIDIENIEANNTKLIETTGWKQAYELRETIRNTLVYWRKRV